VVSPQQKSTTSATRTFDPSASNTTLAAKSETKKVRDEKKFETKKSRRNFSSRPDFLYSAAPDTPQLFAKEKAENVA
jgi:hypothetical protein